MIIKKQVYVAKCNKCNIFFSDGDNEYDCFETKYNLIDRIKNEGWQKKGKKLFCDECRTY